MADRVLRTALMAIMEEVMVGVPAVMVRADVPVEMAVAVVSS
jgi:hypothetical protein